MTGSKRPRTRSLSLPTATALWILCLTSSLRGVPEGAPVGTSILVAAQGSATRQRHRRLTEETTENHPENVPVKEHDLIGKSLEDAGAEAMEPVDDQKEKESEDDEDDDEEDGSEEEAKNDDAAARESDREEDDEDEEEEEEEEEEEGRIQQSLKRFTEREPDDTVDHDMPPIPPDKNLRNETVAPDIKIIRGNVTHPKIAWLMSFPNSGTSFTIHMTREASNTTTATNYAGEGEIKDLPSTQAIDGPLGEQGPFLELIRGRYTNMPEYILTKTHCTGFCSNCGPYKLLFETPRSFMRGCLSGSRAVHGAYGLQLIDTMYNPKLVTKAIHIFRHPLDNTVARFHLEFNEAHEAGNTKYVARYPKNATGFQKWCARSDRRLDLLETRYMDDDLKAKLRPIPCFNEFFKYVQWHNMAFYTTHEMNLDVLYMHYHEYEENFEQARDKVLQFLQLPLVGLGVEFQAGKVYRHYYSREDKIAIREFIREYATRDTWNMVKDYDFEIGGEVAGSKQAATQAL